MGVLACDRNGCGNIMCDYLSHTYGYLCWECYDELLVVCDKMSISDFMHSRKGDDNDPWKAYSVEEVKQEFKNRLDED